MSRCLMNLIPTPWGTPAPSSCIPTAHWKAATIRAPTAARRGCDFFLLPAQLAEGAFRRGRYIRRVCDFPSRPAFAKALRSRPLLKAGEIKKACHLYAALRDMVCRMTGSLRILLAAL